MRILLASDGSSEWFQNTITPFRSETMTASAMPSMMCWKSDGEEAATCGLSVTADLRQAYRAFGWAGWQLLRRMKRRVQRQRRRQRYPRPRPAATLYGAGSATTVRTVAR